jgi:hypothetical protein
MAHGRCLPEGFKRFEQLSDPAIGGIDVVRAAET